MTQFCFILLCFGFNNRMFIHRVLFSIARDVSVLTV